MKTTYTYDHFYLYEEYTAILKKYAAEHPANGSTVGR
jgi:hypothetical protein